MLIKTNRVSIDYRDEGTGTPVIFIHAFPLNQTMWDDQLDALQNHCRAITLDLRGFGRSEVPQGPYLMDQMSADVRGLMTALNIDRAVFVGLSMGGYISLSIYRNYPDSVRAMVLADTRAGADTPEARERRLKSAAKAEEGGGRAIAEDMIPLLLGHTTRGNRPDVVERVRAMIEANSPIGIAGAQRGMAERRDSTDLLPAIDFPTLILVGAEDTLTNAGEAQDLSAAIRGARLRVLEGAGHLSNIESPQAFNAALIEFLETLNQVS
jgi:3-oxoadipate enol-lactonase